MADYERGYGIKAPATKQREIKAKPATKFEKLEEEGPE